VSGVCRASVGCPDPGGYDTGAERGQIMTATTDDGESDQESTDSDHHLFEREEPYGHLMATVFVEPERAAVEIKQVGDETVEVLTRHATNSRGPTVQWMLPIDEAREFVDELGDVIEEIEAAE